MKKKVIFTLCFILLALFTITSGVTLAWLTQQGTTPDINVTVGDINYTVESNQPASGIVVPGDPLGTLTITNNSDIKTNLRIKVTAVSNKPTDSTSLSVGTDSSTSDVLLTLDQDWVLDADGNIYYKAKDATTGSIAAKGVVSSPFTVMTLNGATIKNEQQTATVVITILFQAKQEDHVAWTDLGAINWETGI